MILTEERKIELASEVLGTLTNRGMSINDRVDIIEIVMKSLLAKKQKEIGRDKQSDIDESVEFWKAALKYVRSDEYTPETYNAKFGDILFAWCRRMELIDNTCEDCELFDGEWCGHAPFINKTQPETSNCMLKEIPFDKIKFGIMSQDELASNIMAFIKTLKLLED